MDHHPKTTSMTFKANSLDQRIYLERDSGKIVELDPNQIIPDQIFHYKQLV